MQNLNEKQLGIAMIYGIFMMYPFCLLVGLLVLLFVCLFSFWRIENIVMCFWGAASHPPGPPLICHRGVNRSVQSDSAAPRGPSVNLSLLHSL